MGRKDNWKININNRIRAKELRVIDEAEGNLGVLTLEEALRRAKESGKDLIEIAPTAVPPVAKIMDYGKFQYEQRKKDRGARTSVTETKSLQVRIGTGEHDLLLKARKASDFLKDGHRVKIELFLTGRTKYMDKKFLEERLNRVLRLITEQYKIAYGPQKSPKGLAMIIEKNK